MNPLDGTKSIWLRQWGDTGERTFMGIVGTLKAYKIEVLAQKVGQGLFFQQTFDRITPIGRLDDIRSLADAFAAHGIGFVPVHVPVGRDWELEAGFAADIANVTGTLIVDIEAGPGFWDIAAGAAPLDRIPDWFARLRALAPDATIIAQPDPRLHHWRVQRLEEYAPFIDGWAAQHYIGIPGWSDVELELTVLAKLHELGGKPCYPTLYMLADQAGREQAAKFWAQARLLPYVRGVQGFAFGSAGPVQLDWFRSLPSPTTLDPVAPPTSLSPEWELRVGLADRLLRASSAALAGDFTTTREEADTVVNLIDKAGGF